MEYTIVSGERIKELRGDRTLREMSALSGKAFSPAALLKWERGKQPKKENLLHLLNALGCSYEDIAISVALEK